MQQRSDDRIQDGPLAGLTLDEAAQRDSWRVAWWALFDPDPEFREAAKAALYPHFDELDKS